MHGTSQGAPIPITGLGGLVTLADPTALPEGASPRCHDNDFLVGSVCPRPGLTDAYAAVNETVGPNPATAAASGTWTNPTALLASSAFASAPVNASNSVNATQFNFNLPNTDSVNGVTVTLNAYASAPAFLQAQMLVNGNPYGTPKLIALSLSAAPVTFGSSIDKWGTFFLPNLTNELDFGVQLTAVQSGGFGLSVVYVQNVEIALSVNTGSANFQYVATFTVQDGTVRNVLLDADGNFFVENVSASPGIYSLAVSGITPNSYCVGINGPGVQYLAFSNGKTGSDMPLQYTPQWTDRITQVGPGVAPSFSPGAATANTFNISSITQPAQMSDPDDPGHFQALMWSAGPTSTAPGNVVTVFYSNAFIHSTGDTNLINAFNSGNAVYVYMSSLPSPFSNETYLVTSVGMAVPPGGEYGRWYFTFNVATSNYSFFGGPDAATGYYQQSLATMTTAVPVPGLEVGNQITITGATPSSWNAVWNITETLNSAAMTITSSQVINSIATFGYAVSTGTPPAPGELVTITGTTNANGALNLTNQVIQSASGGNTGTFTLNVSVVNAPSTPEDGQATTAGTIFCFDPGIGTLGTATSPIFGNTTVGGSLTFTPAEAQLISPGTRQGTVFFITRNGYWTCPAPPVTFTCPENTTAINATNIPIGPPNVIARGIALTEAGQNGVPGGNFFTIPTPVSYIVNNQTYIASSLIINDNTSTSASFSFTDPVLLEAEGIDVYGYNLFANIEIGDPGWIAQYDTRMFYGLCWNKVQNFLNLSFDGGYLQAAQLVPSGWTKPDIYGSLVVSPKFGNAYYIQNTTNASLAVAGLISQSAYQDYNQIPIINTNTTYSVRVTARSPSEAAGNLVVSLTAGGVTYGSYTLSLTAMTSTFGIFTGTLLTSKFTGAVPPTLMLNVMATNLQGNGGDVEIDRVEIYPTEIPILTTTVYGSYAGLFEQVDSITGAVGFDSENQQPVNGAMVLYDTFYGLKGWDTGSSLYSLQASANLEPAQWREPEVAQRSGGAIGPMAFDLAEQWFLGASRQGLYLFVGGQPGKISQEIFQIWNTINWEAAASIWVKVDIEARRIYVGVPLPTPNPWLPDAPLNNAPTTPNVILMCNYQGLDSGEALREMPQMHTTMFGTLNAIDMRRKWSIWQIPAPYGNFVETANGEAFYICNGYGNSKVYELNSAASMDDTLAIDMRYTTAGLPELSKRLQMAQQFGKSRVRWGYLTAALETVGTCNLTLYANRLPGMPSTIASSLIVNGIYPAGQNYLNLIAAITTSSLTWTLPGGFTPGVPAEDDVETPLNFAGRRTFFEFRENDGNLFSLSSVVPFAGPDVWNQVTGAK